MVTYPYAYMTYVVSPLAGLGGAYCGGRPPTACLYYGTSNTNTDCWFMFLLTGLFAGDNSSLDWVPEDLPNKNHCALLVQDCTLPNQPTAQSTKGIKHNHRNIKKESKYLNINLIVLICLVHV